MENHENLLQEEQKIPSEATKNKFNKYRLAVAAGILAAAASIQACGKNAPSPTPEEPTQQDSAADSSPAPVPASTETAVHVNPVSPESNIMTFNQADEARKKHCDSKHGKDQETGGTYPFVLLQGSQTKVIDACDPAGAHEVPFYPSKNGNYTDLYIPTTVGREEKNCYVIRDTGNTSNLNSDRVNYKTWTDVTRIDQFAFINSYGTQTLTNGDKPLVKAPLVKCGPNTTEAAPKPNSGNGGTRVKSVTVTPDFSELEARIKAEADRARIEADRSKTEADRSAAAAANASSYARDLEEWRKTNLRNRANNTPGNQNNR